MVMSPRARGRAQSNSQHMFIYLPKLSMCEFRAQMLRVSWNSKIGIHTIDVSPPANSTKSNIESLSHHLLSKLTKLLSMSAELTRNSL
jgi:hypothetical protein